MPTSAAQAANSGTVMQVDPPQGPNPQSLGELEARLARDLELLLIPPAKEWLQPTAHPRWGRLLDVAIIGAGMGGLATAFALKRLGVHNIRLFDRAPEGFEGPWVSYARMQTLRSPPELVGPALGLANLTFRAWFEAQFGAAAWPAVHRISRLQWMAYLRWYRRMLAVPIENEVEITDIAGDTTAVCLQLRSAVGERRIAARRVVLATGRDGLGGPFVPELFRALDRAHWAHSSDEIDFAALRGKTVGVVGAGASAVDNAGEALEAGAARVAMLVRRPDVPRINRGMGIGSPGMWHGFNRLTLAQRWSIVQHIADHAIPPPRDSMQRCSRHENFSIIAGCTPLRVWLDERGVRLETSRGPLVFDYLILCTGFAVAWDRRPELACLAPHVVRWRHRFQPAGGDDYEQADDPFLGGDMEFLERQPGVAPWVQRVHCFTFPAFMSHGPLTGDIPAISVGAERVATGITGALFAEDYDRNWARLLAWDTPELEGDEYVLDQDVAKFAADPAPSGA
jgi:FAD-dependent urate hydroxylase